MGAPRIGGKQVTNDQIAQEIRHLEADQRGLAEEIKALQNKYSRNAERLLDLQEQRERAQAWRWNGAIE